MARTPQQSENDGSPAAQADAKAAEAARLAATAEKDRIAADDAAKSAAADRAAAEALLEQATRERAAAEGLAAAAAIPAGGAPLSAQLEPYTAPRPAREDTVVRERVTIRRSAGLEGAMPGPRFNARAIALPGGRTISAAPAEHVGGELITVRITDRVLHDGVLYEPGSTAEVTLAQLAALRLAGAAER